MLHHPTAPLIALAALVFLAAVVRLVARNPGAARHRVRLLRWRIRLYLRPGAGYANILELAVRWSRLRAVRTGRRARPSLPWWVRMILPVTAYAVRLGRAHFGRRVIASMEDQTLVLAAPRSGKSGWLADRIIDHPGAVVTTTTRTDLFENTAPLRGQHGAASTARCTCSTPRDRRPAVHLPVEPAAGLRTTCRGVTAGRVVHVGYRVDGDGPGEGFDVADFVTTGHC